MKFLLSFSSRAIQGTQLRFGMFAAVIFLLSPLAAMAAEDPTERIRELEKKLLKSLEMIEQLQTRVRTIETTAKPSVPATVAAPADASRITQLEQSVAQIAANSSNISSGLTGIPLYGFMDVGYGQRSDRARKGFRLGSLDLYLTPNFGNGFRGLVELIFEIGENGELITDLERLQVGYDFSDALTLWGGRFHTPYGYWNTAFHHGVQIQTSILRPRFLAFEDNGGILPAHSVGLWATGKVDSSGNKLVYNAYIANAQTIELQTGPGSGVLSPNMAGSSRGPATVGGSVGVRFTGGLNGLEIGAHGLTSSIDDTDIIPNRTRLGMFGGYFVYDENDWEIIGETYQFRNRNAGRAFHSNASFLQIGREFGLITVFGRAENGSFNQADPYFAQQENGRSYSRFSTGLKYNLTPSAALKFELLRHKSKDPSLESYSEGLAQFAVRF